MSKGAVHPGQSGFTHRAIRSFTTLPRSNFIGPGNTAKDQDLPALSSADAVAKEHDKAYDNAETGEDVRAADFHAIKHFVKSIPSSPIGGTVGALGLGLKTLAEFPLPKPIYPKPFQLRRTGIRLNKLKSAMIAAGGRKRMFPHLYGSS